ncbi:DUF362 domain-containing protein [Deltaproteobacteria bacterium IMCC39524]|nr:DUF362 domain-containing protein [Deltaproteobacteria bacterium IMCC39524]
MFESNRDGNCRGITRRDLLWGIAGGVAIGTGIHYLFRRPSFPNADVFITKAADYNLDLRSLIARGLHELGVSPQEVRGKRILLKPNLVEVSPGHEHINTHPLVVRGAIEAFLDLGAAKVLVGEGPGHVSDTLMVLEETGLADVLFEDRIPFIDLNHDNLFSINNQTGFNSLKKLTFPGTLKDVDWIVSLAKMKTHHWAGATLSMKNLFGVMPGAVYGWPKNVLHHHGIDRSIIDINATLKPHFAIVDGITGMQGDGPIMGDPIQAGVLVMGRSLPSVDATCCRVMALDPNRISYLKVAENTLGPIQVHKIKQRGEIIADVMTEFALRSNIPALKRLM